MKRKKRRFDWLPVTDHSDRTETILWSIIVIGLLTAIALFHIWINS